MSAIKFKPCFPIFFSGALAETDTEIAETTNELGRQQHEIDLVASENIISAPCSMNADGLGSTVSVDCRMPPDHGTLLRRSRYPVSPSKVGGQKPVHSDCTTPYEPQ